MCLTVPAKISETKKNNKAIAIFPKKKEQIVDTRLFEKIKKGDYVIISNGFIIKKISANDAEKLFKIIKQSKEVIYGKKRKNRNCCTL